MLLDLHDGTLCLEYNPRWTETVKRIPGARAKRNPERWVLPATRQTYLMLSALMQGETKPTPEVLTHMGGLFNDSLRLEGLKETTEDHDVLMPHQTSAVNFLRETTGAIVADDMGLGKTIESIYATAAYPVLVVAPKSVCLKWQREWGKWNRDHASTYVAIGTAAKRKKEIERFKNDHTLHNRKVLIMNYESLVQHTHLVNLPGAKADSPEPKELSHVAWGTVIVDEAHKIKSRKAKRTRAVKAVGANALVRYALTGTPIADSPEDLFSIGEFVQPETFTDWNRWRDFFVDWSPSFVHQGIDIHGFKQDRLETLYKVLDPMFIRRTKDEVLPNWQGKLMPDHRVIPMETKQGQLYRRLEQQEFLAIDGKVLAATDPLQLRLRRRQLACAVPILDTIEVNGKQFDNVVGFETTGSNKINAVLDIIEEGGEDKLIVFSESKLFCKAIAAAVEKAGYLVREIHEEISPEMREIHVEEFQNGKVQVMCLTTGTGAEGIDLFASNRVVFAQRSDSNIANKQAVDRSDRIGQTRAVQPIYLLSEGTVDIDVERNVRSKEKTLQLIVRDDD